jgi:cytochrome c
VPILNGRGDMKSLKVIGFLFVSIFLVATSSVSAEDKATPREVIQKVREAVAFLNSEGETGLLEFAAPDGRWVWKNSYVWVVKCGEMKDVAHPINPQLAGRNFAGLKDTKGQFYLVKMCEVAGQVNGGWVEYWWPKAGDKDPSRKVAFILQVPNSPYQVAASIYDDEDTISELNQMVK